ncbi:hypothetical protein N9023_04410 [Opitutaceae bacterium]|nr:hypothetical protein [Opitutaceae bacterium]
MIGRIGHTEKMVGVRGLVELCSRPSDSICTADRPFSALFVRIVEPPIGSNPLLDNVSGFECGITLDRLSAPF